MKHLHFTFLFAVLMSMAGVKAWAYSAQVDGIFYNFKGDKAEVTYEYEGQGAYEGDIIIPETVSYNDKTYNVTSIGSLAFSGCTRLTSITIPNSVTSIGEYAFWNCSRLKSIIIPNSVTSLEFCSFLDCSSLTNAIIGNSVTSIGASAFSSCTSLISLTLGNSLKSIEGNAFSQCGLTSVNIPNSVTSIGEGAFANCFSLSDVTMSENIESIGKGAFYNTKWFNLQPDGPIYIGSLLYQWKGYMGDNNVIEIKDGTIKICDNAFYECEGNSSVIIPNSVTSIGAIAFYDCSGLTSVTIPNSVTSIGANAFKGCTNLTSVALHCKEIGSWFSGMTSIKNIELGDEVETIGEQAFYACSGLTSITIPNSVIYIGYAAFWCCTNLSSVALHCKEIGSWFSDMTSIKSIELGDEVETIGANAFKGCTNLSSVALHCKEIGSWFSGMTSIKNIELGDEVETIGANAFMNCSGLTSITIPSSVTTIGGSAFLGCTGLTKVSVSDLSKWCGIEFGSDSANPLCNAHHLYLNGNEITALTIPNSVNSIGSYAFCGGTALKSVTFPSSVTWVAQRAFDGCSGLTSVNISDLAAWCQIQFGNSSSNPLSYAHHLYQNGSEVKDLILPSEITAINDNVFTGGSSFTSVTVPSTITNIGSNAFSGCSGLTAVNIADLAAWCQINFGNSSSNPLSYAHHLYQNSKLITELVIPNSVTSMRAYSFSGCTDLTILTIPSSVTSIGYYAFVNCSNITEVNSQIESPFGLPECFSWSVYNNAILNVPKGTKEDYRSTYSWNNFNTIWDGTLEPVEENNDVDYGEGGDVNSGTNLGGNVVGNIYYNIADENGEYSSAEGCIVVRKPTSDTVVDGLGEEDLFGEALKNAYTGIIFMVQPGSGVISVNAETTGGMTLKVKVGDNPPMEIELDGKMKAKFPYSVDKASYVYIYAGGGSAGAKGVDKAASNNSELKIYGIEWSNSTDGVEEIKDERLKMNDSDVYNLNGQKVDGMPTKKGVYIKDGKKVLVK